MMVFGNMNEFRYVRISESLAAELGELVSHGQSLLLLGPRSVGKRYLIRGLVASTALPSADRVGMVSFFKNIPEEDEVQAKLTGRKALGVTRLEPRPSAVLEWVDERLSVGEGRATLYASNVDALPQAEIQEFLSGLGERAGDRGPGERRLTVVLTAEVDLSRVVSGPRGQLACVNPFVIRGFARPEFLALAGRYVSLLGAIIDPLNDQFIGELYNRTGGNPYLLRLVLWSIFDYRASAVSPTFDPSSLLHLPAELILSQPQWDHYLHWITRLIDSDSSCWVDLERLLACGESSVRSNAPHLLELAGVAVREQGRFILPKTLVGDFVRQRYTQRRFADLYAREAAWDEAFQRYAQLAPPERCRPSGIEDVTDAEEVVKNLGISMYREATSSPDTVLRLFYDGCRNVLGFSEVTRWRCTDLEWEPVREPRNAPASDEPEPSCLGEYRALLSEVSRKTPYGLLKIDPAQQACILAVNVPESQDDAREVIVVGRPWARSILSRAREELSKRLILDFVAAYSHAWDHQHATERERLQKKFTEIASEIVKRLGTEIGDMGGALRRAAELLRTELRYKRVCVSVMDPKGETTLPVVLEADPELRTPLDQERYRYLLGADRPSATLWAIRQRKPCVMSDATTDRRANNEIAAALGIKAQAVIPLIDPQGHVVGIIHVERADGRKSTKIEVDSLLDFGKRLAVALRLSEQIAMLQTALDMLRQPIAIFERTGRTRYLNRHAASFLDMEPELKWYPADTGPPYNQLTKPGDGRDWLARFFPLLEGTFADGKPHTDRTDLTIHGKLYHLEVEVQPVLDWRKQFGLPGAGESDLMAGALFHSQDVSYTIRVFDALAMLISASNRQDAVIDRTVEAARRLGHRWCRLYVVDNPTNPSKLVSRSCFGWWSDPDLERRFNRGDYVIPRFEDEFRWEGWRCLKEKRTVVMFHSKALDDRACVINEFGLEAMNCKDQKCPEELRKKEGEYWIDFPLFTQDRLIGKVTLEWQSGRRPVDVRTLEGLCKLTSMLLAEAERRETLVQEALNWVIHDIKGPPAKLQHLAVLQWTLIAGLRQKLIGARRSPARPELSDPLDHAIKDIETLKDTVAKYAAISGEILKQIEREKEEFQVFPEITQVDLVELIQGVLAIENDQSRATLETAPVQFVMDLDANGFKKILRGMLINAGRYPGEELPVRVTVCVKPIEQDGKPWVSVTITDNGKGVAEAIKQKIFEKGFTSNPNLATGHFGWGFGLYKARKRIEELGGTIEENGTEGRGASFVIRLPQHQNL
jgi:signal transduction histidine kinase/GAF domain-containing protein